MSGRERMERSRRGARLRALEALTIVAAGAGVFGWGGMHPTWAAVIGTLWILLGVAGAALAPPALRRPDVLVPVCVGIAAVVMARGLLPLSFAAGPLEADVFAVWGADTRSTVGVGHAARIAWGWLGVAGLVWAAQASRTRGSAKRRMVAVRTISWLVVGVGLMHGLSGAESLWGVWEPRQVNGLRNPFAAPYVNENQAGMMWAVAALGAFSAAADAARRLPVRVTSALAGVVLVMLIELLLHAHAAVLAVAAGALALLALKRRRSMDYRRVGAVLGAGGAVVAAVVFWSGAVPHHKSEFWRQTLELSLDRPWAGWGAGAFPDVWWLTTGQGLSPRATTAESGPLQLAVDLGWPLAIVVVAAVLLPVVASERRRGDPARSLALALVVMGLVEATVGMGIYGVGLLPLLVLSRSVVVRGGGASSIVARVAGGKVAGWSCLACGAIVAVLAAPRLEQSVPLELLAGAPTFRTADVRLLSCDSAALSEWRASAAAHRPGDARVLAAYADSERRCERVEQSRAVDLLTARMPEWPRAWWLAVELAGHADDRELQCAALQHVPPGGRPGLDWAEQWRRFAPDLQSMIDCAASPAVQAAGLEAWADGRAAEEVALAALQLGARPGGWSAADAVAADALLQLGDPSAESYARRAWEREPSIEALARVSHAMALGGDAAARFAFVREAARQFDRCDADLLVLRAVPVGADHHDVDEVVAAAVARCRDTRSARLRMLRPAARAQERAGNPPAAMALWREIVSVDPDRTDAWTALARLADETGQMEAAERYGGEAERAMRRARAQTRGTR